jgi:hypothetical protein
MRNLNVALPNKRVHTERRAYDIGYDTDIIAVR